MAPLKTLSPNTVTFSGTGVRTLTYGYGEKTPVHNTEVWVQVVFEDEFCGIMKGNGEAGLDSG